MRLEGKEKRKRILKRLIVISLAAVCIGIFLCRQSYTVEQATNLEVAKVNVFVDAMKTEGN